MGAMEHDPITRVLVAAKDKFVGGKPITNLITNTAGDLGYDIDVAQKAVSRFVKYTKAIEKPITEMPEWVISGALQCAIDEAEDTI